MTSTELAAFQRYLMKPVAGGRDNLTDITDTGSDLSVDSGFGDNFSASKLVKRADMNAMFKLATQNQVFKQIGGLEGWNADYTKSIAEGGIGGYPLGVVLPYMSNGVLHFVRSLVENNTYNLAGLGVDGINWEYCLPNDQNEVFNTVNWSLAKATKIASLTNITTFSGYHSASTTVNNVTYTWYRYATGTFANNGAIQVSIRDAPPADVKLTMNGGRQVIGVLILGDGDGTDISEIAPFDVTTTSPCNDFEMFNFQTNSSSINIVWRYNEAPIAVKSGTKWATWFYVSGGAAIESGSLDLNFFHL